MYKENVLIVLSTYHELSCIFIMQIVIAWMLYVAYGVIARVRNPF